MTWAYPGWRGIVYAQAATEKQLANYGLTAYARMPLLRAAEVDRSYYEPLSAQAYRHYAAQVPSPISVSWLRRTKIAPWRVIPCMRAMGRSGGLDNLCFSMLAMRSMSCAPFRMDSTTSSGGFCFSFRRKTCESHDSSPGACTRFCVAARRHPVRHRAAQRRAAHAGLRCCAGRHGRRPLPQCVDGHAKRKRASTSSAQANTSSAGGAGCYVRRNRLPTRVHATRRSTAWSQRTSCDVRDSRLVARAHMQ